MNQIRAGFNLLRTSGLYPFIILVSIIWIALYGYLVSQLENRLVYIDELVYFGQWWFDLKAAQMSWINGTIYWEVGSKQPLFFWWFDLLYTILPQKIAEGPYFLRLLPRHLSALYVFSVPFFCFFTWHKKDHKILSLALAFCLVLACPFLVVHAQLSIVEPLLLFLYFAALLRLHRLLSHPSLFNGLWYGLLCIALLMTKTSALVPMAGGLLAFALLWAFSQERKRLHALLALFHAAMIGFAKAYIAMHPEIQKEQSRFAHFDGLSLALANNFKNQLIEHLVLLPYYLSYLAIFFLLAAPLFYWKLNKKAQTASGTELGAPFVDRSFILVLVCTSAVSYGVISLLMPYGGAPRYYLFGFLPLLLLAYRLALYLLELSMQLPEQRRLKLIWALVVGVTLADLYSVQGIFTDPTGQNSRIDPQDRKQYYTIWAFPSGNALASRMLQNNAVVYGLGAPYMGDIPKVRMALGIKEGFARTTFLPPTKAEINRLSCNPKFEETLVMIEPAYWDTQPGEINYDSLELLYSDKQLEPLPSMTWPVYVYKKRCSLKALSPTKPLR